MSETKTGLALLREPFSEKHISKLPKGTKAQNECPADQKRNCNICGGWHHPQIKHLDYVGHAALTHRLLDADPAWSWEPVALSPAGLPAFDGSGGLWIRLTVCSVSRLGYGHAAAKNNGDPGMREKEVIGDALRNAAMRFGAALDLWHKGDLHDDEDDTDQMPKLTPARAKVVRAVAGAALQLFNEGNEFGAYGEVSALTDNEEKLALWSILKPHSALRSAIKRMSEAETAAQKKLEEERKAVTV